MELIKLFYMFIIFLLALYLTTGANILEEGAISKEANYLHGDNGAIDISLGFPSTETDDVQSASIRDEMSGRFLLQVKRGRRLMTCNKFPKICHAKGSPGHHCCKKKCVDIDRDRLNCGICGKKCKYNEMCCKGKCVNPAFNRRHCGGCNNRCKNGSFCVFGLCNYA